MRKSLTTLILALLALLSVVAAAFLAVDGSLARLTGWYHFRPGMYLFPGENLDRLQQVSWMRIRDLHDTIECERAEDGSWWIVNPFRDRMSPSAALSILNFTAQARLVDSLPYNQATRASLREFGVETSPHTIILKVPVGESDMTTVARYTLGSASPWLADAEDGEHVLPTSYLRTDFYGRDRRIHVVSGNILSIFKNGLEGLRDPHPLSFAPDSLRQLTILRKDRAAELTFSRMSAESPWSISSPTICDAEQSEMDTLLVSLVRMKALRVDAQDSVPELPAEPLVELEFTLENGEQLRLSIYPPFNSPADGQKLCYATVSNRPVVFTLPVEPKLRRRGVYSQLVNNILSLPVLPTPMQARLQNAGDFIYLADLPLTLNRLRSQKLSNIAPKDVDRVLLRSRFFPYPLHLRRIPGDSEGQTEDVWMFSAAGQPYAEADPEIVNQFLSSMSSVPVAGFVHDFTPQENPSGVLRRYGLHQPDYTLILQPRECAARAVLFGVDMPLVKDRSPRVFYMKSYRDATESYWLGMEQNMLSIYRLSPKMTKLFSFFPRTWRKRTLTHFPISALRTLTLNYQRVPLVLHYDYIGESWSGTLGEEDITPRINPHRTDYYVRHLQKIRVVQWLDTEDQDALKALEEIVFSVKLDLELTDYSDVEQLIVHQKGDESAAPGDSTRMDMVKRMLNDDDSPLDDAYRQIALGERKTQRRSITIEVAPGSAGGKSAFFYGRIRETGDLFILSFEDGLGLDGQLLD